MIVCYCRKSRVSETDELDRQVRLVKEYCKSKQYTIDKVFAEVGSSVDADRPEYTALLNLLNKHKNCTIVVTDLDRLSRHTVILGLFQQLCKEQGHLVELTNGTVYNYSDYTDSFTSDIIASVSAYIYQQTKAKMQRGLKQFMEEGGKVGATPIGFVRTDKYTYMLDPCKADTIKQIFKDISEGMSTKEVADKLEKMNFKSNNTKKLRTRGVRNIIKNEVYYKNTPQIVSRELWLRANNQLKSLVSSGGKRTYPLSNKIICSRCGTHLIIGYKADRGLPIVNSCNTSNSNRKGIYPSCSCQGVRLDILENLVLSDTSAYIENKLASMYNQLKSNEGVLQEHKKELDSITAEITANSKKLDKLNDLYLLDNITAEQLKEKSEAIKETIAMLTLKKRRVEGYSLYDKVALLQNEIVRLEELQSNLNIEDATKLIDHILYFKDSAGITVNTIFKHGI